MILSLVLLGVLEYLWLRNEYGTAYRNMEDKLSHVMFSSMRDVEDSLIFSRLTALPSTGKDQSGVPGRFNVVVNTEDSILTIDDCGFEKRIEKVWRFGFGRSRGKPNHPFY